MSGRLRITLFVIPIFIIHRQTSDFLPLSCFTTIACAFHSIERLLRFTLPNVSPTLKFIIKCFKPDSSVYLFITFFLPEYFIIHSSAVPSSSSNPRFTTRNHALILKVPIVFYYAFQRQVSLILLLHIDCKFRLAFPNLEDQVAS